MADTVRTTAALQALLADSAAAHSTNRQLLRDIVVSQRPIVASFRDVSVSPNSGNDETTPIQTLLTQVGVAGGGKIMGESGAYVTTSQLTVAADGVEIEGGGAKPSYFQFAPTADATCLKFSKPSGASQISGCALRNFGFRSNDSTWTKTAIDAVALSESEISGVQISGSVVHAGSAMWSGGAGSLGLLTNGHQTGRYNRIHSFSDRPIVIGTDPSNVGATISLDHTVFSNLYLVGWQNPLVHILDGTYITNLTFEGYQAWVNGTDGLKWVDTITAQIGQQVAIKNVRWEQSTNATGNMIRIEHNYNLQGLLLENCSGGLNTLGIKLRKVTNASLRNVSTLNTSGLSLDVDSTVQPLILDNCFFQSGGTVSVGTLKKIYESGRGAGATAASFFAIYALPATIVAAHTEIPLMGSPVTIAQDADISLGAAANTCGYITVQSNEHVAARFYVTGSTHSVVLKEEAFAGFFSITKDTAARYNVYYDAGTDTYRLQNKRTGSKVVQWLNIGDNI